MRNPWAFSVRVRRGGFADTLARYGLSRPNAQYPTPNTHPTPNIQRPTETLARRTCARCRPSGLEPGCPHPGRWQSHTPAGLRAGRLQADADIEHPRGAAASPPGANASNIQALLPILALDAVARGPHSWRNREKRCRAEYRLPPQDAAAGTEGFGTPRQPFLSAVASGIPRDTALRSKKTEPKLKKCLKIRCVCPASPPRR